MSAPWLLLRKALAEPLPAAILPPTLRLAPFATVPPGQLHALLVAAYAGGGGTVADFATWWANLTADSEFDPLLVFVALDNANQPVALCQCWSGGFVKDLVVASAWRGRGVGEALLLTAFAAFQARGLAHVDLKVETANAAARRLYARLGMVEAP